MQEAFLKARYDEQKLVIDEREKVEKASSEEEILQIWSDLFKSFKTRNLKEVQINDE